MCGDEKGANQLTRRATFAVMHLGHRVKVGPQFVIRIKELKAGQSTVTNAQHCVDASATEGDETSCSADDDVYDTE